MLILIERHFRPHCLFVNGLGPTESTVSIQYFLDKQSEVQRNRVPIGYAVEDTEILLLNKYGTYDDVYGEIAIRSPYVALGYWNKPEETEQGFSAGPGGRQTTYLSYRGYGAVAAEWQSRVCGAQRFSG